MKGRMTEKDFEDLVSYLDSRIDILTRPIPGSQILRLAEAIRTARTTELPDEDSVDTYGEEDYSSLLEAYEIVLEILPAILKNIRAKSISPGAGWRFMEVSDGLYGACGLCAICRSPYQHKRYTVKVHLIDTRDNAFLGVCRECVRTYAPSAFADCSDVSGWLDENRAICEAKISDRKTEAQRIALIDAVRKYAHSTNYFSNFFEKSSDWLRGAFGGEWR